MPAGVPARMASRETGSYACHLASGNCSKQPVELIGQSRRGHGLRQDAQAGAFLRAKRFSNVERQRLEVLPGFDPAAARDELRAIGVVKPEQSRLAEDVGRSQARRMSGVALDLDRPAHLALDQHAAGKPIDRHRRGEEERPARDDLLGGLHVGNDRFGRLISTAPDARQGQRRGRDPQEIAAAGPVEPFLDPLEKLVTRDLRRPVRRPRVLRGSSRRSENASTIGTARAPIRAARYRAP